MLKKMVYLFILFGCLMMSCSMQLEDHKGFDSQIFNKDLDVKSRNQARGFCFPSGS